MSTAQFLDHVLPAVGYRFLVSLAAPSAPWADSYMPNDPALLHAAQRAVAAGRDVYFGVGSYAIGPDGKPHRTAECAALHRCLRVDVDCGEGKPYATKRDGLVALLQASDTLQLPRPTVVDSGYGIHAYWPFTIDLPNKTWLVLAAKFATALASVGLAVDTTTTQDAARILRLPGTTNFKHGAQAPVRLLSLGTPTPPIVHAQALAPFANAAMPTPRSSHAREPSVNDELIGAAGEHPPYHLRGVLLSCPGFGAMLQRHGAGVREPLWKAALDVVAASADDPLTKERVARALSDGHATFDEGEFGRKWTRALDQQYQPATCVKFAQLGMPECAACPHAGRLGSPVQLGRPQAAEPVAQPPIAPLPPPVALPTGAVRYGVLEVTPGQSRVTIVDGRLGASYTIKDGLVHSSKKTGQTEDGKPIWSLIPIGANPVRAIELVADKHNRTSVALVTFDRYQDGEVTVELGPTEQTDNKAFARALAMGNVRMRAEQAALWRDGVMVEFLAQLQRLQRSGYVVSRCGWTDDYSEFVLGTASYAAGRAPQVIRPAGMIEAIEPYRVAGDEAVWQDAFRTCMLDGDRQAVLALSLGAPLLAFTGVDGVMLNAYSPESGVGKTALSEACLSVWGSPQELRRDAKDTMNATFKLAAVTGNLPFVVDEFTNIEGRHLSDFVYTLTQGREKHRMGADAKLHSNTARWCLPLIVTSNNSVHDKLLKFRPDAEAEAARVFEMRLRPLKVASEELAAAKTKLASLREHYGFLGPRLAGILVSRPAVLWRKAVMERVARWDQLMQAGSADRFRSALCAVAELGAELGRILGLPFDVQAVRTALRVQWETQRQIAAEESMPPDLLVEQYLLTYINELALFGGANGDSLARQGIGAYKGEIRGQVVNGRYVPSSVLVPLTALRAFAEEQHFNWTAAREALRSGDAARHVLRSGDKMTFMRGTGYSMRSRGIEFAPTILGQLAVLPSTPQNVSQAAAS